MALNKLIFFNQTKKKRNRIFEGSYLDTTPLVRENPKIVVDLSSDCGIERTIYDIVTEVGFDLQMCGTRYLIYILIQIVHLCSLPIKTSDFYKLAAVKFGYSAKVIEVAISRAIEAVNICSLMEINRIFGCTVLHRDTEISAGSFLNSVCGRLVMFKCHGENKTYFV